MKFSIVVAAYNVAEYLNKCVDSIANQYFDTSNFEVILIDDGSTDQKTSKICDDLSDKYSGGRDLPSSGKPFSKSIGKSKCKTKARTSLKNINLYV